MGKVPINESQSVQPLRETFFGRLCSEESIVERRGLQFMVVVDIRWFEKDEVGYGILEDGKTQLSGEVRK
jgi:hypothetical protein